MSDARELAAKAIDQPHWRRMAAHHDCGHDMLLGSVSDMTTDVAKAIEDGRAEILSMLRELEWSGVVETVTSLCPRCHSFRDEGHATGCRLASLLGRLPE